MLLINLFCYLSTYFVTYRLIFLLINLFCYISTYYVTYQLILLLINLFCYLSTSVMDPPGVRGVITLSGEARQGSNGVKNIGFFGEIGCSKSIFAQVFKVEIVLWY